MKVKSVHLKTFRGFNDLTVDDLPEAARLVVLAGPNGKGKSSIFDAFRSWHNYHSRRGWNWDQSYHDRVGSPSTVSAFEARVRVVLHGTGPENDDARRKAMHFRSAYRVEADFISNTIERQPPMLETVSVFRMIDIDASVASNFQRLASQGLEDLFGSGAATTTFADYRDSSIGVCRDAMERLFPGLVLNGINPTQHGTFVFDKGASKGFPYKNLSGGEKSAFDLLLEMSTKSKAFDDTVFCIDEPEAHLNTRTQAALLRELLALVPQNSQLWIATHSIGMLREARDMWRKSPQDVVFLDFEDCQFDEPTVLTPVAPTRAFWERTLRTALDEVASLVAPEIVVVCEGSPRAVAARNADHDATCYDTIFAAEYPDAKFLSGGNSSDVETDRLALVQAIRALVTGAKVIRLIDRDGMTDQELTEKRAEGVSVLTRRHLEGYLFDDEILTRLCEDRNKPEAVRPLLAAKATAISRLTHIQRPCDDLKSVGSDIFAAAVRHVGGRLGKDHKSFMRLVLAPLVTPDTRVYEELRQDIFGTRLREQERLDTSA